MLRGCSGQLGLGYSVLLLTTLNILPKEKSISKVGDQKELVVLPRPHCHFHILEFRCSLIHRTSCERPAYCPTPFLYVTLEGWSKFLL